MARQASPDICYLCDLPMGGDRTRDHVPPLNFFPEDLRKRKNFSRLDVVWAHRACNAAFMLDEQYFFHTLAPLARRTEAGPSIWKRIDKPILTPRELDLRARIAREFSVDDLGRVHKTYDQSRVERIVHKMLRGLWFLRFKTAMPEAWRCDISIFDPTNPPPADLMKGIESEPSWGFYPEVFFFKFLRSTDQPIQAWTLFLWDWFVIIAVVHEQGCACFKCVPVAMGLIENTNSPPNSG